MERARFHAGGGSLIPPIRGPPPSAYDHWQVRVGGRDVVRSGRRCALGDHRVFAQGATSTLPRVLIAQACACSYASRTSPEIRPRLETSMPFATAHARISLVEPPLSFAEERDAGRLRRRPPTLRA